MELLSIIAIGLLLWFWWDSLGTRQAAIKEAKRLCHDAGVTFLDDSVALTRQRLARSHSGSMTLERHYMFEFCTDGEQRYRGMVALQAKRIQRSHMEAYRIYDE